MKKYILIFALVIVCLFTLALKSIDAQPKKVTYAIITNSSSSNSIYIHYGAATPKEEIVIKRKENVHDKMVDVLNDLERKGYELISADTHAYVPNNQTTIIDNSVSVMTYTMRKVE
jgi:hypothetical protein